MFLAAATVMKILAHRQPLVRALVFVASLSLCIAARSDKRPVTLSDLPQAVRKTVLLQTQSSNILELARIDKDGNAVYEVEFRNARVSKTVLIDSGGTVLEIREPIQLSLVSPPAKQVIANSVGDGTIITLQCAKTGSGIIAAYEVRFKRNNKASHLRIAPDGRLVSD